jgi:hypothetical protein
MVKYRKGTLLKLDWGPYAIVKGTVPKSRAKTKTGEAFLVLQLVKWPDEGKGGGKRWYTPSELDKRAKIASKEDLVGDNQVLSLDVAKLLLKDEGKEDKPKCLLD